MKPPLLKHTLLIILALFMVLVIDSWLPLGVAIGILYVLAIIATLPYFNQRLTVLTATIASVLISLGYWISPPGLEPWIAQSNRIFSICAIWVTAWVVSRTIGSTLSEQDLRQTLEQQIRERTVELQNKHRATLNLLQDIEHARQENLKKEKQFRLVIEAAPSGMIMVNHQGQIVLANALTCALFGYTRDELLGQLIEQLIPERFRATHPDMRIAFFAHPEPRAMGSGRDLFGLRKDGTEFPVEIGLNPVTTEQGSFVLASIVDITERKQTEESLQGLLRQNQLLLNSVGEGIYGMDTNGATTFINPAGTDMLGYTPEELVGLPFHDIAHHTKPDGSPYPAVECPMCHAFRDGLVHRADQEVLWRKDGTHFPVQYTSTPIKDDDGTIIGAVVAFDDMTEQKQANEALLKWTQALERSNKELDDFAYITSHDLKEPLRGIHNFSRFLVEDYAPLLGEEGNEQCQTIMRLSQRMEELINTLLYFSRIGRTDLAIHDVDLDRVVLDVLDTLQPRLDEEKVSIRYPKPLPVMRCDEARVGEIFRNLITNAMKYNDKTDKWIEIGCVTADSNHREARGGRWKAEDETTINAPSSSHEIRDTNDERLHFYVRDNGIGIPEKHFEDIYRIFKRLQGRDKFGGGTGAGLTIVQKIIHRHGGKIWVESTVGEGTTFWFTLMSSVKSSAVGTYKPPPLTPSEND